MAVVLRLSRAGTHKAPFYHVVATDSRKPRDGRYLEDVGQYDPTQTPIRLQLKVDRVDFWLKAGAKPSPTVAKLIKLAKAGGSGEGLGLAGRAAMRDLLLWLARELVEHAGRGPGRRHRARAHRGPGAGRRSVRPGPGHRPRRQDRQGHPDGGRRGGPARGPAGRRRHPRLMAWVRLGTVVRAVGLDGKVGVAGTEGALSRMSSVALRQGGSGGDRSARSSPPGRRGGSGGCASRAWRTGPPPRRCGEARSGGGGRRWGTPARGATSGPTSRECRWSRPAGDELGQGGGALRDRGRGRAGGPRSRGRTAGAARPWVTVDREQGRVVVDAPPGLLDADDEEARRTERKRT